MAMVLIAHDCGMPQLVMSGNVSKVLQHNNNHCSHSNANG